MKPYLSPCVLVVCLLAEAATPSAQRPAAFEVASIKENRSRDLLIRVDTEPGGRFLAVNTPLRSLLQLAYGVADFEIIGAPDWAAVDRFDIVAQAGEELAPLEGPGRGSPQVQQLLQALLRDRFALVAHREQRERPGLALVTIRAGQPGPQLTRTTTDCAALFAKVTPDTAPPACGFRMAPGSIVLEGLPISSLANGLSGLLGRQVVDRSGLAGNFNLQLHWDLPARGPDAATVSPDGAISLPTALGDQAGLRLSDIQVSSAVLVIDSVQRPTAN
jgi:uncharacterized protein (TIGR03435 family)